MKSMRTILVRNSLKPTFLSTPISYWALSCNRTERNTHTHTRTHTHTHEKDCSLDLVALLGKRAELRGRLSVNE